MTVSQPTASLPEELRRILGLAWPIVVAQLGWMGMGVADVVMLGRLGEEELASAAIGNAYAFAIVIVAMGAISGLDPAMSQAFGAGRPRAAGRAALRGALILSALSVPVVALHAVAPWGLDLLGQPSVVAAWGGEYVRILGLSVVPLFAFQILRHLLQAKGLMWPATVTVLSVNLLNIVGNWALMHGHLGLPALGIHGCAWSTGLVRLVMPFLLAALALSTVRQTWPGLKGLLDWSAIVRLARVSLPVGLQTGTESWAFVATALMMGWLGTLEAAAHAVAINISAVAYMVPFGIGQAAATRVGNLLGAGHSWSRAAWTAVGLGVGFMSLSAMVFLTIPGKVAGLYTPEPDVRALAATLVGMAAFFQLFDGAQAVLHGSLRGAGDTRVPTVANAVGFWVLGIPLGAVAAFWLGWGAQGLWMGLIVGLGVVSGLLALRLRSTIRRGGFRVE